MKVVEVKINGKSIIKAEVPTEGMLDALFNLWPGVMEKYPTQINATTFLDDNSTITKSWELPEITEGDEVTFFVTEADKYDKPTSEVFHSEEEAALKQKYTAKLEDYQKKLIAEMESEKNKLQS